MASQQIPADLSPTTRLPQCWEGYTFARALVVDGSQGMRSQAHTQFTQKEIVMRVTPSMLLALLIMLGTLASAAGLANAYDFRDSRGYKICDHGDC